MGGVDTPDDLQGQSSPSSSFLKERRFKLSRACDRCRRRRIKCDEGHPCQACLNAKSSCTFEEPSKRHPHKSKRTATLEDRMHHLETLISAIPPAVFAAGSGRLQSTPSPTSSKPSNELNVDTSVSTANGTSFSPTTPFLSSLPTPSSSYPLINPSTHFASTPEVPTPTFGGAIPPVVGSPYFNYGQPHSSSYLYMDDEGFMRWQGESSGLPLLDMLVERHANLTPGRSNGVASASPDSPPSQPHPRLSQDWFPDRPLQRPDFNAETMWRIITTQIAPDLMDSLVQCYLSTTHHVLPFLHIPSFLQDYGNPQKWGEPGFASFIVAICCIASRHIEDPRVRADPKDGITAGAAYFALLDRLRLLPLAHRPTLYTVQTDLIAAVYAVGLGRLTKAASLLSEAVAISMDAGLHRSSGSYDWFDPVEEEIRKRTFWCVYLWDKQLAAHFGRPCLIHFRDCDVEEPSMVDDDFITRDGILSAPGPSTQPNVSGGWGPKGGVGLESRMAAFVLSVRTMIVLESVLDGKHSQYASSPSSFLSGEGDNNFLARATLLHQDRPSKPEPLLGAEESLLNSIHLTIPPYWEYSRLVATGCEDPVRLTQAGRLLCAEQFVRLLIYRARFTAQVAGEGDVSGEREREAVLGAYGCAAELVNTYMEIARRGLMTYYGVHVIHQLTQAGRALVAVLLNCNSPSLEGLIPQGLETVRNCIGLLRRFSGRYVCGLRSGDLMEEFCRLTNIPLDPIPRNVEDSSVERARRAWIRPVRKKTPSAARSSHSNPSNSPSPPAAIFVPQEHHSSPERFDPSTTSNGLPSMDFDHASGRNASPNSLASLTTNELNMNINLMALLSGAGSQGVSSPNTAPDLDVHHLFTTDSMLGLGLPEPSQGPTYGM